MKKLRKIFTASVMAMTVLSMSIVAAPTNAAVAQDGDLIKTDSNAAVYYLKGGKRYVFPNEATYFSWYADWNSVVTVSQEEIGNYPLKANVTMRPGTRLVTSPNDAMVYAVEPEGELRSIVSEENAIALYGADWASNVVDIIDSLFVNYNIVAPLTVGQYPEGTLIQAEGESTVYYVDADGLARQFADGAAFLANRFQWKDIVTASTIPAAGTTIDGEDSDLIDTAQGSDDDNVLPDENVGSGLMASISADTPAAGNAPVGATVEFLKFNLTAANDGDVTVESITISAYDLGDATDLENVTFYDNGVKVGTSKNMSSDREKSFSFSDDLVISAGTTKTLTVKAKLSDTSGAEADSNYALGVKAASDIVTNGAAVSGSFPIVGNTKAAVSATIGTAIVSNSEDNWTATAEFGEDDVLLAEFDLDTTEEPVIWETATFKNGGDEVVNNLRIFIDGDEIASAEQSGDFITFDLDSYLIDKDESVNVEIYGDIAGTEVEAGDTIEIYIDDSNDFVLVGQDYGYGVSATVTDLDTVSSTEGIKVTVETGDVSLDIDKSSTTGTPAMDIENDTDNIVIATFTITSNGSDATVESIDGTGAGTFAVEFGGLAATTAISTYAENIELRNTAGGVYDLTYTDSTATDGSGDLTLPLELTEEFSLNQGSVEEFEVRLDLLDTVPENATIQFHMNGTAYTIETEDGDAITDITGGGSGAVMTVKGASADYTTKSLTDKSVVPGAEDILIYKAALEVGDVSEVEIASIQFTASTTNDVFHDDQISDLELWIGGNKIDTESGSITDATRNYIKFTSLNTTIDASTDVYIELYANFESSFTTTGTFGLSIATESDIVLKDKDNDSMSSFLINPGFISRDVTLAATGDLKVELKTDDKDSNNDTYILAGSTTTSNDKYVGELVFTTENEDVKVETLVLAQSGTANGSDYNRVYLYNEDGEVVAYDVPNALGHANFDSLDLVLPADESTSLFIGVETKSINADGDDEGTATQGRTIQLGLASTAVLTALGLSANEAVTAQGVDSGEDITLTAAAAPAAGEYSASTVLSKTTTITGSLLTAVENSLSDGTLAGGSRTIGEYKFVFDNGANRDSANDDLKTSFEALTFTVASSSVTLANVQLYDEDNESVKLTASSTAAGVITFNDLDALEDVDGEVTLVLKATVTIDPSADNYYLQTSIADLSSDIELIVNGGSITNPLLSSNDVEGATLD